MANNMASGHIIQLKAFRRKSTVHTKCPTGMKESLLLFLKVRSWEVQLNPQKHGYIIGYCMHFIMFSIVIIRTICLLSSFYICETTIWEKEVVRPLMAKQDLHTKCVDMIDINDKNSKWYGRHEILKMTE